MLVKRYQVSIIQNQFWRSNVLPWDYVTSMVNAALYTWNLLRDLECSLKYSNHEKKKENSNI